MSMLQALTEQGINIPDDVALVGFDDFDSAGIVTPPAHNNRAITCGTDAVRWRFFSMRENGIALMRRS